MDFQMIQMFLFTGVVALVLFKAFEFVEIKQDLSHGKPFWIVYHITVLIFSAIVFCGSTILGLLSIENKEWILLIVYLMIGMFGSYNLFSYVPRFAFCLIIWNSKKDSL